MYYEEVDLPPPGDDPASRRPGLGMALLAAAAPPTDDGDSPVGRWQYTAGEDMEWRDLPGELSDTLMLPEGLMPSAYHRGPLPVDAYLAYLACGPGASAAVSPAGEREARRWRKVRGKIQALLSP